MSPRLQTSPLRAIVPETFLDIINGSANLVSLGLHELPLTLHELQTVVSLSCNKLPNKTTATQIESLTHSYEEHRELAEAIPSIRGKGDTRVLDIRSIRQTSGDHAGDVKARKKLLDIDRKVMMFRQLGQDAWKHRPADQTQARLKEEENAFIEKEIDKSKFSDLDILDGGWEKQTPEVQQELLSRVRELLLDRAHVALGAEVFDAMDANAKDFWWRK